MDIILVANFHAFWKYIEDLVLRAHRIKRRACNTHSSCAKGKIDVYVILHCHHDDDDLAMYVLYVHAFKVLSHFTICTSCSLVYEYMFGRDLLQRMLSYTAG